MKVWKSLLTITVTLFLVACTVAESQQPENDAAVEYNFDSWRTMIPDSCTRFFDGCNKCARAPGAEMAACTRMACMKYEKPVCLDDQAQTGMDE